MWLVLAALATLVALAIGSAGAQQNAEPSVEATAAEALEYETITSGDCVNCHEESDHGTTYEDDVAHSIHDGLECLDCHQQSGTIPHREVASEDFTVGCHGCRTCHDEAAEEYKSHGRAAVGTCDDIPQCSDCHGGHEVLPSRVKLSKTHPVNLPDTCGRCHDDLNITRKYEILIDKPVEIYRKSVHGKATKGGIYVAATCNDCHSANGTAHRIYSPGVQGSSINHFNIPKTCGKCHQGVENDFWEGIHGKLVARGETDAPVCTHCHGEHGVISPDDPLSPVSRARLAEETCSPCHESAVLNVKYGRSPGRLASFIDSYHGLKSKAGDTHVANCASCHGVHRILPSTDETSTIYPGNLQMTCGECHPGITTKMAAQPIHGVSGQGLRTRAADVVAQIYIVAIVIIIGLMLLHWMIDVGRHVRDRLTHRPQVMRMTTGELWQHNFLMISFIVLVISGFALRFSDSWFARFFFGWEGGFELRGTIHRGTAIAFLFTSVWHVIYLFAARRGRAFFRDMIPGWHDFAQFGHRILYNLGRRSREPRFGRFSYVEKAEYWALLWGSVIMVVTGLLLWFDNWFIGFLPKGALDVALVAHYYEAWLATLAILVWHLYSTVFSPAVYPMNPSWLNGRMPEGMYRHEHPEHFEEAKAETAEHVRRQARRLHGEDDDAPPKPLRSATGTDGSNPGSDEDP
jgi:cytochrome b subunit of formate dehydrogenase